MPDASPPASSPQPTPRRQPSRSAAPRLLLTTRLDRSAGRQLANALDERMQIRLPHWHLSIRDPRESVVTAPHFTPNAIVRDTGSSNGSTTLEADDRIAETFTLDPALAGMTLADFLLRLGYRHFSTAELTPSPDSPSARFAVGFREELRRADLPGDALVNAKPSPMPTGPAIAAALAPDAAPTLLATLGPALDAPTCAPRLHVDASAHWLARSVVRRLESLDPSSPATPPLGLPSLIPPQVADAQRAFAGLTPVFVDALVADLSAHIDFRLSQRQATDIVELAQSFDVPRRTLERRFREELGTSIHREITRRQIALARIHLLEPESTPASAADLAAYPNTRMLSINFRKLHGLSPRAFQRHHLDGFP